MKNFSITRRLIIAAAVLVSSEVLHADELGELTVARDIVQLVDATDLNYKRRLAVDAASIGDSEGVLYSGYVAPTESCLCTNMGTVSIICEDCDKESDVDRCHLHDRACQDAAQAGGIREHQTFFCVSPD